MVQAAKSKEESRKFNSFETFILGHEVWDESVPITFGVHSQISSPFGAHPQSPSSNILLSEIPSCKSRPQTSTQEHPSTRVPPLIQPSRFNICSPLSNNRNVANQTPQNKAPHLLQSSDWTVPSTSLPSSPQSNTIYLNPRLRCALPISLPLPIRSFPSLPSHQRLSLDSTSRSQDRSALLVAPVSGKGRR